MRDDIVRELKRMEADDEGSGYLAAIARQTIAHLEHDPEIPPGEAWYAAAILAQRMHLANTLGRDRCSQCRFPIKALPVRV